MVQKELCHKHLIVAETTTCIQKKYYKGVNNYGHTLNGRLPRNNVADSGRQTTTTDTNDNNNCQFTSCCSKTWRSKEIISGTSNGNSN